MEVLLADKAGFCFGVKRAVELAEKAGKESPKPVRTFGPLIHNNQFLEKMEEEHGITSTDDLSGVSGGTLIIRAHGVPKELEEEAAKKARVINATCPFVQAAQQRAAQLKNEGYSVVIIGEPEHSEVKGINSRTGDSAVIVESADEAKRVPEANKIGVVVQTTQSFDRVSSILTVLLPKTKELRVFNTICTATEERQTAAAELAQKVDVMVVVGGKHSGNTKRLAEICSKFGPAHHVETAEELEANWFKGMNKVGVTAGASTPDYIIQEVIEKLKGF